MTEELSPLEQKVVKDLQKANLTDAERKLLLKQLKQQKNDIKTYDHRLGATKRHRFMVISDTHIGEKKFLESLLFTSFAYAKKYKPEAIYHCGDITEGMCRRPGHIYNLSHIGTTAQVNYTAELFSQSPVPIFGITGNHDQWAFKDVGVDIGDSLENMVEQFNYLGQNEADIILGDNIKMKLFHANDGSAYAQSYKLQKLIESFTGGEKPHILFEGHYHKALYSFIRNVHGFEAGTLCGQTEWMRGKKLAANTGFWMVDLYLKNKGRDIESITPRFIPYYLK